MKRLRALSVVASMVVLASPASARVTRYLTGNPADVSPALFGPVHDLGGGSTDVEIAIQWMIDQVRGCTACPTKVDVVFLRASGADGYNSDVAAMNGVDSVESLVITRRGDANSAAVETTVKNAEVIFFAGGDQCDYTTLWKGTKLAAAVDSVYARGGGIGGTSAGTAILGEFVYDSCGGSATSVEALANPYARSLTMTQDFFAFASLRGVLTDQHFVARDRMGRLLAMLAREIQEGRATTILGVAADEETSIVIDQNGLATVIGLEPGTGTAYFVLADHRPEVCAARKKLSFSNYKIWRVRGGGTFDLRNRPVDGSYSISVVDGVLSGNPY